ncbi:MAG: pantoate kinase [Natronomonas sp.]
MAEPVTTFVPGHVTGFFSACRRDDPTRSGSRGAGVTLSDGVRVSLAPGTGTVLNGESIEVEPVERVLEELDVEGRIEVETTLPLGSGFGISGAISLGTALAANVVFGLELTENELVAVAHRAEIRSGTGLGDVVAQARGGVPIRIEPGAPPYGRLDGIPDRQRVEFVTFGELSTEAVLSGDVDGVTTAGERALQTLLEEPTLSTFLRASRRFANESDLLTPRIRDAIDDVRETGGDASMAMLGETVFALGSGLTDAGYEATKTEICPTGAHLTAV